VEKLQLRRDFPTNPLIKTYDALWESCRSIGPLQLLFLEIFKLVDTFWSFVISKAGSRNWNGRRRRGCRVRVHVNASFFFWPRVEPRAPRRTDASAPPRWAARVVASPPRSFARTPRPGMHHTRFRDTRPRTRTSRDLSACARLAGSCHCVVQVVLVLVEKSFSCYVKPSHHRFLSARHCSDLA
jgi:hypothetical protein